MTTISLAGSTGSIGTQAVDVIATDPDRYEVVAIGAARSVDVLVAQAERLRPKQVAIADASRAAALEARVPPGTEVLAGPGALAHIAALADVCVNGVVGFAGLQVTLAALEAGKRLALANKESLIAAGPVVQRARSTPGAEIIPVDSEHCAVHQCLRAAGAVDAVRRIVLTASGGPFRGRTSDDLRHVTIADALAHPTWSMGPKITVDSSTLMNKGLEVIEAVELFGRAGRAAGYGLGYDQVDIVVRPQSIVHSMVETTDGATMAQLSMPDMRLPIGYALAYPDRLATAFGPIDWTGLGRLDFEPPDRRAFPCIDLAYQAGRAGGTAPAWLSGANEVAVQAFLDGLMPWAAIADVIAAVLDRHDGRNPESVDVVLEADRRARELAGDAVRRRARAQ